MRWMASVTPEGSNPMGGLFSLLFGKAVSEELRPGDPNRVVSDLGKGSRPREKDMRAFTESRREAYDPNSLTNRIWRLREGLERDERNIASFAPDSVTPEQLAEWHADMGIRRQELALLEEEHKRRFG